MLYIGKMTRKHKKKRSATKASCADRYDLYLQAVQAPEHEVPFFDRVFRKAYGRPASILREDFCGTFAVCCQWVKGRPNRHAIGVDLDPEPLAWGIKHNLDKLKPVDRTRIELLQADVRGNQGRRADVLAAQNFSFWIFKTRDELARYFSAAHKNLRRQGVLVLDMMGGSESIEEDRHDETEHEDFTYIWDQARFDPITHDCTFFIHFKFSDGSELPKAFRYDWRFWTLPEVREILLETGFKHVDVYWEGTDPDTGEGNDVFRVRNHAPSEPAWICYVVAHK